MIGGYPERHQSATSWWNDDWVLKVWTKLAPVSVQWFSVFCDTGSVQTPSLYKDRFDYCCACFKTVF